MLPLLIGGIIVAAIISELTTKKPGDKGENVVEPKAPKNDQAIDPGNAVSSDGVGNGGSDPSHNHQEVTDNGASL